MRQTTQYLLLAGTALTITLIGIDPSMAASDLATLSGSGGQFNKQIGGSAKLIRQGAIAFGALMAAGGCAKFYANAKDGFKEGAKGFVIPAVMALAGGFMMSLAWITDVGRRTLGAGGTTASSITDTSGDTVGW